VPDEIEYQFQPTKKKVKTPQRKKKTVKKKSKDIKSSVIFDADSSRVCKALASQS